MKPNANYPLGELDDDPRFTYGLVFDIADVLTKHGFSRPEAGDWADLMLALWRFIYQHKD